MKRLILCLAILTLAACRGEPVPRDYQNEPPAMTHPATSSSATPSAHGMPGAAPEPSSGAEGGTLKRVGPPDDAKRNVVPNTASIPANAITATGTVSVTGTVATKKQ